MCGGRTNFGSLENTLPQSSTTEFTRSKSSGMEFESDWTKHRKTSAYAALAIRSATSFMPWSCKIPIAEGYHEFL
ncbi:hypothetical protein BT93_H3363 [Corymbia citriodora subsp. variegata]|nr:hypothetical protein BT93_H3363 [Corymbia citriodora subsp. variegata]